MDPTFDAAHAADATDVTRHHGRLFGIAYRMLGDAHDAEELVQETYLRWHQADRAAVAAPEGWLVSVVTRLSIDRLRRARTERQAYTGPWLPQPIATPEPPSPDRDAELASELSLAFLLLLERLAPEERAAFLLRELFDAPYAEVAAILGRSEPAARQLVHRARHRVREGRARVAVAPDAHARLVERFVAAVGAEDRDALLALLAPDATFTSDGGGRITAARRTVLGADRVARLLLGLERKYGSRMTRRIARVNGEPAILTDLDGQLLSVITLATDGERITACYLVINPEKLGRVG